MRIHRVPYTGNGSIRYIFRIAMPITIPGKTSGSIAIWSSIQRDFIEARTISQAAKNVMRMAPVADVMLTVKLFMTDRMMPVSYTHLRAHETPEHLVCRLLLEKKK